MKGFVRVFGERQRLMPDNADRGTALQRKYYTETAERYEEMHELEPGSDPADVDFIISMLRMLQARTLLDVGTASGRTLRNLKSAIPGKLDASIAHQRQRDPVRHPRMVRRSRAGSSPALPTEHFDCALAR
jgi:hypothetical protein